MTLLTVFTDVSLILFVEKTIAMDLLKDVYCKEHVADVVVEY
jgi:hypothetical protein